MKALVLDEPGDEPKLAIRDIPIPKLGPGDVLVKVKACGFCYHDVVVMQGLLHRGVKPQVVLGHEISGEVAEVGDQVSSLSVGDRVASILTEPCGQCSLCRAGREHRCLNGHGIGHSIEGGFAEMVKLHENSLAVLPTEVGLEKACIFGCPMGVALQGIRDVVQLKAEEIALVTGAGGGLGSHAVQICKHLEARVLAVTTSPEKAEGLEGLGADEVILAGELDFGEMALALTEEVGVDVVIDTVGSVLFDSSFRSLAQYGRMVILGEIAGGRICINPAELLFRDASIMGSSGTGRKHLQDVASLVAQGKIKPVISQTFPLERAAEAYRLMRERKTFGRVALVP